MTGAGAQGLDGLRGLAALSITVLHVWMYTDANDPRRDVVVDRAIGELRTGVVLFFVLSAFLLAGPWIAASRGERPAPGLGHFALRRASRILPAYLVTLAGALLLIHGAGHPRDIALSKLPLFLAFAQNLDPATRSMLDPPMWTLPIEVSFYVALPFIGWGLVRLARAGATAGPLALCVALLGASVAWVTAGYVGGWEPEVTWTLLTYLGAFACGIAAAVLVHGRRIGPLRACALALAGAGVVLANATWHSAGGTGAAGVIVGDLPAAAGYAAVVAAVAARPARLLGSAPLRALGAISLGLYLWHMPVMYALQVHRAMPETFWAAVWRVLAPTVGFAIASWVLVERPAVRWSARALGSARTQGSRARAVGETG